MIHFVAQLLDLDILTRFLFYILAKKYLQCSRLKSGTRKWVYFAEQKSADVNAKETGRWRFSRCRKVACLIATFLRVPVLGVIWPDNVGMPRNVPLNHEHLLLTYQILLYTTPASYFVRVLITINCILILSQTQIVIVNLTKPIGQSTLCRQSCFNKYVRIISYFQPVSVSY